MARKKTPNPIILAIKAIGLPRLLTGIFLAAIGGYLSLGLAVSGISRTKNPEAALRFVPTESNALAAYADQIFFANPGKPQERVKKMALKALEQQAANPKALRILGFYADSQNDPATARKLISLSSKLSRREPGAQLWLIESTAQDGTVAQTLRHYDILLRTKPDSSAILYPQLLSAIDNAEIRTAMRPYMKSDKSWVVSFLNSAINDSKNLPALISLIVESGGLPKSELAIGQAKGLLGRLAAEKQFDEAHRLFRSIPGAKTTQLTNPAFNASDADGRFGVMGWNLIDQVDGGSAFSTPSKSAGPVLSLYINASTTRMLASKLLYLQSGNYRFTAQLASIDRAKGGSLKWHIRCPTSENTPIIWSVEMDKAQLASAFAVPANCPVQYLELTASGGSGQNGLEATIKNVGISVASGGQ